MSEYKLSNVPITKIYRSTEDRQGNKYESSKGNPFTKVDIYIDPREISHPDFEGKITYFDYFGNTDNWDVGTMLNGEVVTKESRGRTYFNFNIPSTNKKSLPLDVKKLGDEMRKMKMDIAKLMGAVFPEESEYPEANDIDSDVSNDSSDYDNSDSEIDPDEDLPF